MWLVQTARRAAAALGGRALDLVYPGFCRECGASTSGGEALCTGCAAGIRWISSACRRCGLPVANPGPESCGDCAGRAIHFDAAAAAAEYTGPWRTAVLRFKYLGDHGLRSAFGMALEGCWRTRFAGESPGAIVPVPPSTWRKFARGRDHVEDLALDLGARLEIPVRAILRRVRWIPSQTSLPRDRRMRNPDGAYALARGWGNRRPGRSAPSRSRVPRVPRTVLLLDDVLTTGATVSECARALKGGGAERVLVLALARSPV